MRLLTILIIALLLAVVSSQLMAQATATRFQPTVVTVPQLDTVRAAFDSLPRTIDDLVRGTTLPEPVVRSAVARLLAAKEIRYRMVPVANGDTTATGRPRRERAYYLAPTTGEPRE